MFRPDKPRGATGKSLIVHGLSIGAIVAAAACGAILGDNVGFWAGRGLGRTLLLKHGHRIGINERELILGEYLFQRYGGSIVFFGRFVAFLRVYAALLAGANRLHPLQFTKYNASGGIVWAAAFGIAGYALGRNMLVFAGPLGWLALAATAIGAYLLWSFYKTHEERLMVQTERALTARKKAIWTNWRTGGAISEWKHNQQQRHFSRKDRWFSHIRSAGA